MPNKPRAAYLFLAPFLGVFVLFWVWPIAYSAYLSVMNTRGATYAFAPQMNWGRLLQDPAFANALQNTLIIMGIQVPVMIILATLLAVALNSTLLKGRGLVRFAFFAPVVVSEVAYAAVFRLMFNADFGVVNKVLANVGLPEVSWFSDPEAALAVIIIAVTWRWVGYNAIIILSGLQSIPQDVYEAATLDRVPKWKQFLFITVPLLKPVLIFAAVLSIIGSLQLFVEPFLITDRGGPGGATETLGLFIYRQGFNQFNFGYASAIAYTLAAMAVFFSALNLWLGRERT
ncbi:MAG: sugar ABC transporter permease [Silicimonas sp.]|jgi:lactose/L-arabinose transport system permease protein|uniref:carbohydrate ABC transporter permease n=1 Tax=Alphaproteobacteria TaxID=28211 RepID=UPI0032EC3F1C